MSTTKKYLILVLTFAVGLLIFIGFEGEKIKRYIKSKMAEKPHDEKALVIIDSAKTFAEAASAQYYLLRVKIEKGVPLPAIQFSKAGGRNLVINLETWP